VEKIMINLDGKEVTIKAAGKVCEGLYIADDNKMVEQNNKLLDIRFDPLPISDEPQHRITKIGDYSFLTTKSEHGYFQHIITPSVDNAGFKRYVSNLRFPELQQMLQSAFMLTGSIRLG
jgi:hypothetical protein